MIRKLRTLFLLCMVINILLPVPLRAVSDFYSDSNIQFYDPTACDPNGQSGGAENTTATNAASTSVACCPSGGGDVALTGSENQQKAFNFFVSKGYEPYQAAGIVGNLVVESGVEPQRLQGTPPGTKTPANRFTSGGWGIAQWTQGSKFINPVKASGKDPNDLGVQLGVIDDGLNGKGPLAEKQAGDQLKTTKNVTEATEAFQGSVGGNPYFGYERPLSRTATIGARTAAAKAALIKYGGAAVSTPTDGSTATPSVCCPSDAATGSGIADGSPSDWKKMYMGSNKTKVKIMARGKIDPKILVIHYTEGDYAGQSLLDFFATGSGQPNGIQFNVDKDGTVYQYYPLNDMQKTNHVGQANSKSIGIEITGKDVTELMNNIKQFNSVASLAKFLCDKYNIPCSEPKGDITGDGLADAQGMLGHDETPTNNHNDPDAKYGQNITRTDSSKHPYMMKLRSALGFNPTPGKSGGAPSTTPTSTSSDTSQCTQDSSGGKGTKANPVGDGVNRVLALEAVRYDTKANNNKYMYVWGALHGPLSELESFASKGGGADCSGFVRYIIWRVYGEDIGSIDTGGFPSSKYLEEVNAKDVAAGDIGWRSDHVDFITENKGGGKLHQFGAHSTLTGIHGGEATTNDYDKYFRYIGPKGAGGGD